MSTSVRKIPVEMINNQLEQYYFKGKQVSLCIFLSTTSETVLATYFLGVICFRLLLIICNFQSYLCDRQLQTSFRAVKITPWSQDQRLNASKPGSLSSTSQNNYLSIMIIKFIVLIYILLTNQFVNLFVKEIISRFIIKRMNGECKR